MQTFRRITGLLLTLLAFATHAQAQVTTSPVFFTDTTPVTITYDATQGNGALAGFTGDVYIWTGTVTNLSTSNVNWRNVHSPSFSTADPTALMTRSASNPNIYTITFTPRTYYPIPAAETLLRLGMIFKNASGTIVGRATGGGDIFVDAAQAGLSARITSPVNSSGNPLFVAANSQVAITGTASAAATLTYTLNGTQVAQQANATTLSTTVTATQSGRNVVRFTATAGASSSVDSLVFVVRPAVNVAALPAGAKDGVTYLAGGTSVIFNLTAPNKDFAYVVGEFNNWQVDNPGYMNRTPDGTRYWIQLNGLTPGREYAYQYLVDGNLRVADPYCEKVLDPSNDSFIPAVTYPNLKAYPTGKTTGIVSVLQTAQTPYVWTATNFQRPSRADMVVYELHLRDFIARHDYQTLRDTLNYIQRLGINAIELMPINEFEGNESWGYNPSFYFAPDKYYGTKDQLKRLIDECHRRGIAVVLDMVLNHSFGQSPMVQLYFDGATGKPAANSPWFNVDATHPYNVGYDFNHESAYTKYFSKRVMEFWLQEYHIDGYRFDLSKGFTQVNNPNNVGAWGNYDQSRINIWKDYYDFMKSVDSNVYCILEHFADNSEEKVLSDYGMMLWGNAGSNYNEATMGYLPNSNFSYGYYGSTAQGGRGWTNPNLVTYMESHDEERLMFKNLSYGNASGSYSVKNLATALARQELAAAFFFTVPGPKMVWQFGEVGYDISIDQNGRVGNKPILWNYYQDANRRQLYNTYRALIALKKVEPVFENPTTYTQQLAGAAKSIHLANANTSVTIIGNFDVTATTIDPAFQNTGKWYNYLSGDSITVTNVNAQMSLAPGQFAVYTSRRIKKAVLLPTRAEQAASILRLTAAPNPAQGSTTLRYELPAATTVSLTVRNVLGQAVLTLPATRETVGAHTRELPLGTLAAGVYIIQLRADGLQQTQRLVVE
ncbi:alpha-amylase family glycosyl hydrolase [Hymenobacter sp. DH14]|uniref:Alpha-amylase family glycosyl hydrolase n=1 Tax=Hymenobacter cyanobacteriorum TaxID=2926463 RepID=A0A9X1VDN5_9BACT|nr:alpha-amylase family glycosyl hydrolase [Hymenobacter cyanobacteriorum]MCI1187249.1 alpha-amylase family glycosyl hydrolase [Hymenobacter cyanobacteriorum]